MDKSNRIKELVKQLSEASFAYYGEDNPIMSDKQYDDLYDELTQLESETGIILAGSPTQKVQGYLLDGFEKVEHSKPMLSADKTKDPEQIKKFLGSNEFYASYKLDGLTIVVRYKNGEFVQGITRGTDGRIGENVTDNCRFIKNLPMKINYTGDLELRGECVISWNEFNRINSFLDSTYSHPRNLAAGTIRNYDQNIIKKRNLSFIVFEVVTQLYDSKLDELQKMEDLGFECVSRCVDSVDNCIDKLTPESYQYPVDGLIFEINDNEISKKLGATTHHENCRMALKWSDQLYETTLQNIEWSTSKTGLINPVAVFDPVDLDGAITSRATLHNISYIEELELGYGDEIQVYRANAVIPKVHDNLTRSNTWSLPDQCPVCGGAVEIRNENGSKMLHCLNSNCDAKLLKKLVHFVSKGAVNIDGLSEQTLSKLVDMGWIETFEDIYHLSDHKSEMMKLEGFGKRSTEKLLDSIENSRSISLDRFLNSLSIHMIGKSASKTVSKYFKGSYETFLKAMKDGFDWTQLEDFGATMSASITNYAAENIEMIENLAKCFVFEKPKEENDSGMDLLDKTFVITGSLSHYKNRNELVGVIESKGGKVAGSVSKKTDYLINNDTESNSSKNKKAKELGIPIISEEEFLEMIKEI